MRTAQRGLRNLTRTLMLSQCKQANATTEVDKSNRRRRINCPPHEHRARLTLHDQSGGGDGVRSSISGGSVRRPGDASDRPSVELGIGSVGDERQPSLDPVDGQSAVGDGAMRFDRRCEPRRGVHHVLGAAVAGGRGDDNEDRDARRSRRAAAAADDSHAADARRG
jgi:hypothetical protein